MSGKRKPKSKTRTGRSERPPARPLVEYKQRVEAEKALADRPRATLKQRLRRVFPLFKVIGVAELGLALTMTSAVLFIWIKPHLWVVGLLLTIAGLLVTRYGADWLSRE